MLTALVRDVTAPDVLMAVARIRPTSIVPGERVAAVTEPEPDIDATDSALTVTPVVAVMADDSVMNPDVSAPKLRAPNARSAPAPSCSVVPEILLAVTGPVLTEPAVRAPLSTKSGVTNEFAVRSPDSVMAVSLVIAKLVETLAAVRVGTASVAVSAQRSVVSQ